jgi:hypothetical protein
VTPSELAEGTTDPEQRMGSTAAGSLLAPEEITVKLGIEPPAQHRFVPNDDPQSGLSNGRTEAGPARVDREGERQGGNIEIVDPGRVVESVHEDGAVNGDVKVVSLTGSEP